MTALEGIFNHWFSVGPVDLWKAGDQISERAIRERITVRPEVEKTNLAYEALLFKFQRQRKVRWPVLRVQDNVLQES